MLNENIYYKNIRIILISLIASIAICFIFLISFKNNIFNTEILKKDHTSFVQLQGKDEYIITELKTSESYIGKAALTFLDHPIGNIGETSVDFLFDAYYRYFVRLGEIHTEYDNINKTFFVQVPKLYLSTPVAFDSSTIQTTIKQGILGPNYQKLYDSLIHGISEELKKKGNKQIGTVYDSAAKSLADNLNNHFMTNGNGNYYKSIVVVFLDENSKSQRQFNYNKSICGEKACFLQFNLGKSRFFAIK